MIVIAQHLARITPKTLSTPLHPGPSPTPIFPPPLPRYLSNMGDSSSVQVKANNFDSLPTEILHLVLLSLQPQDLARVALVCHSLHDRIYSAGSDYLWTQLYLKFYDIPHPALHRMEVAPKWDQTDLSASDGWNTTSQIRARDRAARHLAAPSLPSDRALLASIDAMVLSMTQTQLPRNFDPSEPNNTFGPSSFTSETLNRLGTTQKVTWSTLVYPRELLESRTEPTQVANSVPSQSPSTSSNSDSPALRRSSRLSAVAISEYSLAQQEDWRQVAAHLHCLHGPCDFPNHGPTKDLYRGKARELVYGTARYAWENSRGPFLPWRVTLRDRGLKSNDEADETLTGNEPDSEVLMEGVYVFEDGGEEVAPMDEDDEAMPTSSDEEEDEAAASPVATNVEDEDSSDMEDADWEPNQNLEDSDEDDDDDDDDEAGSMAFIHLIDSLQRRNGRDLRNAIRETLNSAGESRTPAFHSPSLTPHILRTKTVNWALVEAVMLVMHCNLTRNLLRDWRRILSSNGIEIQLGAGSKGAAEDVSTLNARNAEEGNAELSTNGTAGSQDSDDEFAAWSAILNAPFGNIEPLAIPTGWEASRGEVWIKPKAARSDETVDEAKPSSPSTIRDWAHVNSLMIGTYAFLDFSDFLSFNIGPPTSAALLSRRDEAVGPILQLQISVVDATVLSPKRRAEAVHEDESTYATSAERDLYPPLHFKGTSHDLSEPGGEVRGHIHGHVRPVFEGESSATSRHENKIRPIAALHWTIVHRQDGEDRWHLSGVQPGPPGTLRPIYGIWSDAERVGAGPQGPFMYWQADRRPHEHHAKSISSRSRMFQQALQNEL